MSPIIDFYNTIHKIGKVSKSCKICFVISTGSQLNLILIMIVVKPIFYSCQTDISGGFQLVNPPSKYSSGSRRSYASYT